MKELFVIAVLVAVVSVTSLPHVIAQSTDVDATARICGIETRLYNNTADRLAGTALPDSTTGFSFGTLNHGQTSPAVIIDLRPASNDETILRAFGSDWNDFDGNFVMNGNQTHVSPRQQDNWAIGFPLNSTGQYVPDGVGPRALPQGSSVNDARDGIILPTQTSGLIHILALAVHIPGDTGGVPTGDNANPDLTPIIDDTYQGSIHQVITLQFEC